MELIFITVKTDPKKRKLECNWKVVGSKKYWEVNKVQITFHDVFTCTCSVMALTILFVFCISMATVSNFPCCPKICKVASLMLWYFDLDLLVFGIQFQFNNRHWRTYIAPYSTIIVAIFISLCIDWCLLILDCIDA